MQTPAPVDYARAHSVAEALELLERYGPESRLIAGGHSLIPMMRLRIAQPERVIDINDLTELDYIRSVSTDGRNYLAIGALTRHRAILASAVIGEHYAILHDAERVIADPIVRNRGTIGGSLAHGDGASDLPAVVLALGGTLVARGPGGTREIAATDFFSGFLETALEPDELLCEIRVPKVPGAGWSFQKFNRRAMDWAIVGAAVVRTGDQCGIGLVNMSTIPLRAGATEAAIAAGASIAEAAALADHGTEPNADLHASVEYRRHLARVLVGRGLEAAS